MQADISNAPVNRPMCVETTAMGAAYLAGLAVGYWASKEDVLQNWAIDRTFTPGSPTRSVTRKSHVEESRYLFVQLGEGRLTHNFISKRGYLL